MFGAVGQDQPVGPRFREFRVDYPHDVAVSKLIRHEPRKSADSADAEMAKERLGSDESYVEVMSFSGPSQHGVDHHGNLVGWTDAACAGRSTDDDAAPLCREHPPERIASASGLAHGKGRMRMAALRSQAGNGGIVQFRPRSDNQNVVLKPLVFRRNLATDRIEIPHLRMNEADASARQDVLQRHLKLPRFAQTHNHPRQRGHIYELLVLRDDGDFGLVLKRASQRVGGVDPAEGATDYYDSLAALVHRLTL